jgi:hypothetical protein
MARWAMGLGLPKRAKTSTKVHLPIPSQGCAKMETQLLNKGKTMETSTGELIAKLTNLSHNLALELRFKESSLVLEAVGALHALPNIAETIRDSWHPSLNTSGPSKGLNYLSTVKLADDE